MTTFTKYQWLDLVAEDPDISPPAVRAAHVLVSRFLNRAGNFWPSHELLGFMIHVSARSAGSAVRELVDGRYLDITFHGVGRGIPNRYRLSLPEGKNWKPLSSFMTAFKAGKTGRIATRKLEESRRKTGRKLPPNTFSNTTINTSGKNGVADATCDGVRESPSSRPEPVPTNGRLKQETEHHQNQNPAPTASDASAYLANELTALERRWATAPNAANVKWIRQSLRVLNVSASDRDSARAEALKATVTRWLDQNPQPVNRRRPAAPGSWKTWMRH